MKRFSFCFFICFLFFSCVSDKVVVESEIDAVQIKENVVEDNDNIDDIIEDKSDKVSDKIIEEINPKLTNVPIFLPEGTDGSFGRKGKYVLFGDWPQSLKANDVVISPDDKGMFVNGWRCFTGSDGAYYVKVEGKPFVHRNAVYHFENGNEILEGEEYYFKLEPIKWRLFFENESFDGASGEFEKIGEREFFLVAENILVSSCFFNDKTFVRNVNNHVVYPNNYKYSSVRAFLNNLDGSEYGAGDFRESGFLKSAFSVSARDLIIFSDVDNGVASTKNYSAVPNPYGENKFASKNTDDKVFLISKSDVTNKEYGFDLVNLEKSKKFLIRKLTDFAKATGAGADIGGSESVESVESVDGKNSGVLEDGIYFEVDEGWWWTRSPFYRDSGRCYCVFADGDCFQSFYVNDGSAGVVPGLRVRLYGPEP